MQVRRAMLLAAGLGTRMRPLTDRTAKPLLPLGGRTLIDHALDRLAAAGVEQVVVNVHWQAALVVAHLAARSGGPEIVVQREDTLLETGGAVLRARDLLGDAPFLVVNGDTFWLDGPTPALGRVIAAWDSVAADAVMLVHRTFQVQAEVGAGDFALDKLGLVRRRREREIVPYIYAGIQLIGPDSLRGLPDGAFSMNVVWDRIIGAGRLRAVVHDGLWFHLSTPPDLVEAEHSLHAQTLGEAR
jgi:MurNAc alpha-1-phosphate uridylyltransferase